MSPLSIVVEYEINEQHFDAFAERIKAHAARSLREDDGCLRFDVLQPAKSTGRLMLYEMWRDKAALAKHSEHPAMDDFRKATEGMLKDRKLTICNLVQGSD
jgi:quinol monooxygenase YgiN